ncbi:MULTISPECIES: organic hydroperoxide resistance protein [Oceanobacillus]|uniref:Organic hydroperoxide resistance protein n=1 Tax=Oceanobacillus kimchii TaxID=746691 RepID=A0ABQ5TNX3_9BACI|nr:MULTISPECIES: organic hydroperoxide resistance protein [Oceanobacillus]MBT2599933.1 organic hydroperoxide resistance protein [Oceanobacillus sp. ISL-74]MBT2652617.1 organic hydroperoxide resistance protein [Oceanobacillus sp. ISL-73]OEH56497.1 organic hydroperoxide resistance protein [Oceanobacillus sp. E9]GLO68195.1 organic hydroperoxide resistance protein [Oceanobacillus kimchii]
MGSALYTASSTASGGRQGSVKSSDGTLDLTLSLPKGLGGNEKEGTTNPEQLFSAGYAACFDSALQMVAGQVKKKIISEVTAEVSIEKQASGFGLSVNLTAKMEGVTQVEAEELMEKAHKACPYSRAIEGNVEVKKKAIGE